MSPTVFCTSYCWAARRTQILLSTRAKRAISMLLSSELNIPDETSVTGSFGTWFFLILFHLDVWKYEGVWSSWRGRESISRVMTHLKIPSWEALSSLAMGSKYSYANRKKCASWAFRKPLQHQVKMTHPRGIRLWCTISAFSYQSFQRLFFPRKPHSPQRIEEW